MVRDSSARAVVLILTLVGPLLALHEALGLRAEESGLLESLQLGILALGAVAWLWVGIIKAPSHQGLNQGSSWQSWRATAPTFAAVCLTGFGREVSWGKVWSASDLTITWFKTLNVAVLLILVGASLARMTAQRLKGRRPPLKAVLMSGAARLIGMVVTAFIVADVFEKGRIGVAKLPLFEEGLELVCYSLILTAALSGLLQNRTSQRPSKHN